MPTPEPAKMPILWPLPMVSMPSMALTPNSSPFPDGRAGHGIDILFLLHAHTGAAGEGTLAVNGLPQGIDDRPLRNGPMDRLSRRPVLRTKLPAEIPFIPA